jgi:recombination protein RecA
MYNEGISVSGDVLTLGTEKGVIDKKGNSYSYGEVKMGVGKETAKGFLKENPKILLEIRNKILEIMKKL